MVLSILESDAEAVARRLERAPAGVGYVEIRADALRPEDVAALVGRSSVPVIVTARPESLGGRFRGTAEEQWERLRAGLGAGAALVDVELDGPLARLAWSAHASRMILSHHEAPCEAGELLAIYRAMAATPAARLKIVPRAQAPSEIRAVREVLAVSRNEGRALACFALGPAGRLSRLLAPSWGSWATYGAAAPAEETADGQLPVTDLLDLHDVLAIGPETRRFALVGRGASRSPSPAMHMAAYREQGLDARYLPLDAESLEEAIPLLLRDGALGIEAFAVTIPFKEPVARRCRPGDEVARVSGAVNTVLVGEEGWVGHNTDGPAAVELIRRVLDPAGARIAIVGAGGTARGIGAALALAGGRVTLFGRTPARAAAAAAAIGAAAASLDTLPRAAWDVLVQATPLGAPGEPALPESALSGRVVLDAPYGTEPTPLVREARAAGLDVFDGVDLLAAQGRLQLEIMTGLRVREDALRVAARAWLARS